MSGLIDRATGLAMSRSYWLLVLAAAIMIGPSIWPVQWSGNEINYFDLSYRFARPDVFTEHHAVFDASNGRIVSFLMIGTVIELLGFESAKTVFALTLWLLSSLGLAAIAHDIGLRVTELAVSLLIFVRRQGILGNEWLFDTVEAKGFAYIAVFYGITLALNGRWAIAMVATAIATYMHFLVGGFWALALIVLFLLKSGGIARALRLGLLFFVLILPIFLVLLYERVGVAVDVSDLDRTLSQIYTEYSVHFHVAPLMQGLRAFITDWLPGLLAHLVLFTTLIMLRDRFADRALALWLIGLNLYALLALGIYMLDDGNYRLAQFYLLRPAGLTYLLSLMAVAHVVFGTVETALKPKLALAGATTALFLILPQALTNLALIATKIPPHARLEAALSVTEREVLEWIRTNTLRDDAIAVEPVGRGSILEGDPFPGGLERLTGRGFIVNYKYIPTYKPDLVRWYKLLQARQVFFRGDCSQNGVLDADYAVIRLRDGVQKAGHCVEPLYANEEFVIGKVLSPGTQSVSDGS